MPVGKACSQAGHAFVQSFLAADGKRQWDYHQDGLGTKICLGAPSLFSLLELYEKAKSLGLPCALIEDTGRNTTFGGVPTVSAVGIGPLYPEECSLLKDFSLLK